MKALILNSGLGSRMGISTDDFVQIFYLVTVSVSDNKVTKIGSQFLKYNPKIKGLR